MGEKVKRNPTKTIFRCFDLDVYKVVHDVIYIKLKHDVNVLDVKRSYSSCNSYFAPIATLYLYFDVQKY